MALLLNKRALHSSKKLQDQNLVTVKELSKGIKNVQLNRPEKLNSLNIDMFESICQVASELKDEDGLRVIILNGSGKAFCTGLDVKSILSPLEAHGGNPKKKIDQLLKRPSEYQQTFDSNCTITNLAQKAAYLWREIPVPVIASLHGMCFGAGEFYEIT